MFGGGGALLALGLVAQPQDGAGWAPRAPAAVLRLQTPGLSMADWSLWPCFRLWHACRAPLSSGLARQCCCLMIAGSLGSTLTFSLLPRHSSSQNTCVAGLGPLVKNNILFLLKVKIIFFTSPASRCFHLNVLQDQVAMISACLLLSFLCYEWDVAFVC